jgi:hypothetical protein
MDLNIMTRIFYRTVFVALMAITLVACNNDGFTIEGTIDGGAGKTLWLEELGPEGQMFIDSIPIDADGHFSYSYTAPYPSMYNLHAGPQNYIVTQPNNGEKVKIEAHWNNLSLSYSISGSPQSELLWQLQQYTNQGIEVLQGLVDTTRYYSGMKAEGRCDEATVKAKRRETDSIFLQNYLLQQGLVQSFIEENYGSLTTLIALYKNFSGKPLIDPRDTDGLHYYDLVLQGLKEQYPDNPHTIRFQAGLERLRNTMESEE